MQKQTQETKSACKKLENSQHLIDNKSTENMSVKYAGHYFQTCLPSLDRNFVARVRNMKMSKTR